MNATKMNEGSLIFISIMLTQYGISKWHQIRSNELCYKFIFNSLMAQEIRSGFINLLNIII